MPPLARQVQPLQRRLEHLRLGGETPRILFLHYWGRGPVATLAANVKKDIDLTKAGG